MKIAVVEARFDHLQLMMCEKARGTRHLLSKIIPHPKYYYSSSPMAINSSVSGYNPNPAKQPTDLRAIFTVVGWVWLGS